MRYRRAAVAGATDFFTVNLADRQSGLLVNHFDVYGPRCAACARHPFHIDAMVVLPDHPHAIWTLPAGDSDYSMRWMLVKAGYSESSPRSRALAKPRRKGRA